MPLYEYECFLCHHRFERIQRFSGRTGDHVPGLRWRGAPTARRVPALQFKGSGFYITDYGKGKVAAAGRKRDAPRSQASICDLRAKYGIEERDEARVQVRQRRQGQEGRVTISGSGVRVDWKLQIEDRSLETPPSRRARPVPVPVPVPVPA